MDDPNTVLTYGVTPNALLVYAYSMIQLETVIKTSDPNREIIIALLGKVDCVSTQLEYRGRMTSVNTCIFRDSVSYCRYRDVLVHPSHVQHVSGINPSKPFWQHISVANLRKMGID